MPSLRKKQLLEEISQKLEKASGFVLTDYRGLTHQQMEALRRALKEKKADFTVIKNSLFKLALKKELKEEIVKALTGSTAVVYLYQDQVAPLSEIVSLEKNLGFPKFKVGILDDKLYLAGDLLRLANLPSREVLLATLAMRMKSPIYGLHYALSWDLRKLVLVLNAKIKKGGDDHGKTN